MSVSKDTEKKESEIDLLELAGLLWSKLGWILLTAVICGAIGLAVSIFLITPRYEASINMIVNTRNDSSGSITNDNITSAQKLVDTYAVIIKSNLVLQQVIDELSLDCSYNQLNNCVSVSAVNDTQVMKVVVNDTDLERAVKIVEKLSEIAPPIIVEAVEAGSCKVVSSVYASQQQVSPNVQRNTLLAALVGVVLSMGVIIVRKLLDNTFENELDIQNELDIPVLGMLPSMDSCLSQKVKRG